MNRFDRTDLSNSSRIIVKIGTSLLDTDTSVMEHIIEQIHELRSEDREIVLVTSGAIFFGSRALNRDSDPVTLPQKQAIAAVGQPSLMNFYARHFKEYSIETAQVLLTQQEIHNRETYLNASNTLNTLLDMDVIPVINENDTVATEEIQFGNNDTLASLVTTLVDGDVLIILSDVDGLYEDEPSSDREPISRVEEITDQIREWAGPSEKGRPTVGGMITKIEAAETLINSGTPMGVVSGYEKNVLNRFISGEEVGTLFVPQQGEQAVRGRKRWIGYHLPTKGSVVVDEGAEKALVDRGTSLLPSGVTDVSGQFQRGDVVKVYSETGDELARGLTNYEPVEIEKLKGCQTEEISDILGYHDFDEIIHRDNLVILTNNGK
ncbi:MAG: glutamate 5-kinase [bacterium]